MDGAELVYNRYYSMISEPYNANSLTERDKDFLDAHRLAAYVFSQREAEDEETKREKLVLLLSQKSLYKKAVKDLLEIADAFTICGIDYIVLKGVVVSNTYPEPFTRQMGDHDILVRPEDVDVATHILHELGYQIIDGTASSKDIPMQRQGSLLVELHYALYDTIDSFEFGDFSIDIWNHRIKVSAGDGELYTVNPDTHFCYLMIHMMKHLKFQGFGIRYLLDIKYFCQKNHIDVMKHYDFFNSRGLGNLYLGILRICSEKLGMDADLRGWISEEHDEMVDFLADYIAECGVFGQSSERLSKVYRYQRYSQKNRETWTCFYVNAFFPNRSNLGEKYRYARKSVALLPIAWLHRIVNLVFRKDLSAGEKLTYFQVDQYLLNKKQNVMSYFGL